MPIQNLINVNLSATATGTSSSPEEPITLEEAKLHLKVTHSTEDALIQSLLTASRQYVEKLTSRAIVNTTFVWNVDRFPSTGVMILPRSEVLDVTSVKYYDSNGTQQTWDDSDYIVQTGDGGYIAPLPNKSWPDIQDRPGCVEVTYEAGFVNGCPDSLVAAIKLYLGHLYANRESELDGQLYSNPAFTALVGMSMWGSFLNNGDYHLSVSP